MSVLHTLRKRTEDVFGAFNRRCFYLTKELFPSAGLAAEVKAPPGRDFALQILPGLLKVDRPMKYAG